ncbi:MAG: hypothetical protein KKI14_04340 [Nanoarchaeota archaeon]|nr:hypothetical protein [Nanoarchaeota archaeon]
MAETTGLQWWEDGGGTGELIGTAEDGTAGDSGAAGKVFLEGRFLDHDILEISVEIADIQTPVLGTAFHLKYDSGLLSFLRYDPGEFLERGGDPFYLVTAVKDALGQETGEVVYGETLRRNDEFPVGEGGLAEFYFQQLDPSVDVYEFDFGNGVVSTLDVVRQDIDHVEFENLVLDRDGVDGGGVDAGFLTADVAGVVTNGGLGGWIFWVVFASALLFSAAIFVSFKMKKKKKFANFYVGV